MMIQTKQLLTDRELRQQFINEMSIRRLSFFTGNVLGFANAKHHEEWYSLLQDELTTDPEADWDSPLIPNDPVTNPNFLTSVLAPRSHSKSTCFTVNYPLWRIGKNPNIRILIVSASATQSEAFLREIKGHMTLNANYRYLFGDLFPKDVMNTDKWTNTEIIVNRTNPKLKDATVSTASAGGTILGRRADLIICDDILNEKNTKTADQRAKIKEWFNTVLMPVLEPDGKLVVVGTAWNSEDLYHEIMGMSVYNVRKRYKAVIDPDSHEVLWPSRWSYEKLMQRKKQVGSVSFNKSYQNEAQNAEDAVFQSEWLNTAKAKGRNRTLIQRLDYARWDLGGMTISMGVDLAISKKDGSDFTAMAIIGQLLDGRKLLLHAVREKLSPAETKSRIISLAERFNPDIVIVESNAYQESLKLDLADTTSIPVKAYNTGGEKFDPEIGINSLAIDFENGKWILPYSVDDPNTITLVDHLTGGMMDFPAGHTEDLLMATWFANTGLRQLTTTSSTVETASASDVFGR